MGAVPLPEPAAERILIPVGVVVALVDELRCLPLDDDRLRVLHGGVGRARARAAAARLAEEGARGLLSFGVAAGLDPGLPPGSVLLPAEVVTAHGERLATDAAWRRRWRSLVDTATEAPLAEAPQVLATPADKRRLFEHTGAGGADMESAAVLEVAREHGLPALVARVVLDGADRALPRAALAAVDESGAMRPLRLAAALMRRPSDLAGLLRLSGDHGVALRRLRALSRAAFRGDGTGAADDASPRRGHNAPPPADGSGAQPRGEQR